MVTGGSTPPADTTPHAERASPTEHGSECCARALVPSNWSQRRGLHGWRRSSADRAIRIHRTPEALGGSRPWPRHPRDLAGLLEHKVCTVGSVWVHPPLCRVTLLGPASHDLTRDILGMSSV